MRHQAKKRESAPGCGREGQKEKRSGKGERQKSPSRCRRRVGGGERAQLEEGAAWRKGRRAKKKGANSQMGEGREGAAERNAK